MQPVPKVGYLAQVYMKHFCVYITIYSLYLKKNATHKRTWKFILQIYINEEQFLTVTTSTSTTRITRATTIIATVDISVHKKGKKFKNLSILDEKGDIKSDSGIVSHAPWTKLPKVLTAMIMMKLSRKPKPINGRALNTATEIKEKWH